MNILVLDLAPRRCARYHCDFKYRRGKLHASSLVVNEVKRRVSPHLRNVQPPSRFALAMPEHLRESALTASPSVAVERYRAYYNQCKQGFWRQGIWVPATWGKREVPEWFVVRGLKGAAMTQQIEEATFSVDDRGDRR